MTKQNIGVFFGSRSTEHDVSIVTAIASVIKPLRLLNDYHVVPVYIAKDGRWYTHPRLAEIATYTSGEVDSLLVRLKPLSLRLGKGLALVEPGLRGKLTAIDIAFPATHGTHGEDGELMAVFELAGIPYVGCRLPASAVAMDKVLSKQTAASHGIAVTPFRAYAKADYESSPEDCLKKVEANLTYPLFVKPPHLGSSIGISRASNRLELTNAIEVALRYDNTVLIEEAVQNLIEVTLPIIGNEQPVPALLERPLTSAEEFFDFETKYMNGGKKGKGGKNAANAKSGAQGYSEIPAKLPQALYDSAQATGLAAYKALGCTGTARIDMLIDSQSKTVYFNEANPLPGSLYSHNWNKAGVSNVELMRRLIGYAQERYQQQQAYATTFDTSYLKQF